MLHTFDRCSIINVAIELWLTLFRDLAHVSRKHKGHRRTSTTTYRIIVPLEQVEHAQVAKLLTTYFQQR